MPTKWVAEANIMRLHQCCAIGPKSNCALYSETHWCVGRGLVDLRRVQGLTTNVFGGSEFYAARGSSTWNVAPRSERFLNSIEPPRLVSISEQIARPIPSPSFLVVKKGVKSLARKLSGTPGPSSSTTSKPEAFPAL